MTERLPSYIHLDLLWKHWMKDKLVFSSLPLQRGQQLHVTKSVGFTLFVVFSHTSDLLMLKIYPQLWVFLCNRDPKCTNKTWDVFLTTGCFFSPPCNFRLLAVRTKQVWSSAKPGAWKNKPYLLLVRAAYLTGKHWTPTGEPELIFLIIARLISFAVTLLVVYLPTNADLNPSS